jgi:hypothetical protein
MDKMLKEISLSLNELNIEFDPYHQHIRCLAHIINIGVQKVLKNLHALGPNNESILNEEIETEDQLKNIIYKVSFLFLIKRILKVIFIYNN